jgi:rod shape-determining protein MreD
MRFLEFGVMLVTAILVQLLGSHLSGNFVLLVDTFLLITVLFALQGGVVGGMFAGLVAGLAADALSGGPFGLHGFADTIIGYGTALTAHRLVIQRASGVFAVAAAAAAVQQIVLLVLRWVLLESPPTAGVGWLLARVALTGVLAAIVYLMTLRLQQRLAAWRESRGARIRFGR